MKRLLLLRHGKSSWADKNQRDFDRPLKKRGRRAAAAIGAEMVARGLVPDRIVCSTARRTRETLEYVVPALLDHAGAGEKPDIRFEDGVYLAEADALIGGLATWGKGANAVLVVGHNPAMQDCALRLAGSGPAKLLKKLRQGFPTGALAVLACEHGLGAGKARLEDLLLPRELD